MWVHTRTPGSRNPSAPYNQDYFPYRPRKPVRCRNWFPVRLLLFTQVSSWSKRYGFNFKCCWALPALYPLCPQGEHRHSEPSKPHSCNDSPEAALTRREELYSSPLIRLPPVTPPVPRKKTLLFGIGSSRSHWNKLVWEDPVMNSLKSIFWNTDRKRQKRQRTLSFPKQGMFQFVLSREMLWTTFTTGFLKQTLKT